MNGDNSSNSLAQYQLLSWLMARSMNLFRTGEEERICGLEFGNYALDAQCYVLCALDLKEA